MPYIIGFNQDFTGKRMEINEHQNSQLLKYL